ncbi:hypothetical protein EYZ11_006349 [Aspergillus tanneri]|uniref:Choline kinase N-terminal domain-containing protein n=1 Tax=Aspergillus tanneri TaxID=1220188 RepID=A0A4S3JFN3_9EURO|nr:hypothetical protein EYZ11_006349 [Aspergillus tanneri]
MPSFTHQNDLSGPDIEDLSFQRIRPGNGLSNDTPAAEGNTPRKHRLSLSKKATARPPIYHTLAWNSQTSSVTTEPVSWDEKDKIIKKGDDDPQNNLFYQVYEWLQREQSRRRASRAKTLGQVDGTGSDGDDEDDEVVVDDHHLEKTTSHSSERTLALDQLEKILLKYAASCSLGNGPEQPDRRPVRRRHQPKGLRRSSASESDYPDLDSATPGVDAMLDNSKTLAYSGGSAEADESENGANTRRAKDREAWMGFKSEILRLTHTLQLRGWRKIPTEYAGDIEVVRLSGALTNAVYVVTPPQNIPTPKADDGSYTLVPRKPASKLLLRIYGPQVDHLIDRDNELQILRRLGRKNIGPKVLGTFKNGRFEEYFNARPLTPKDLRDPGTMKQIAKRMRELHEGIDLLEEEREGGPMVFRNWDKWVDRCEKVTNWLDKEICSKQNETKAASEPWRRRGFVCGVPWPTFRRAVENYRKWLVSSHGGMDEIKRELVFAHNDTQYGNLLRMEPSSESPLLRPENEHKQLVVIDFEYASANTPGFEFANHFTEWCYNYHDVERPWACSVKDFPRLEEQRRFISAYLTHRPGLAGQYSPSITPLMRGMSSTSTSMAPLSLDDEPDVDAPSQAEIEKAHEISTEKEIQSLMKQMRLWRVINSAQWVAWGIVQAKAPGMEEGIAADEAAANGFDDSASTETEGTHSTGSSATEPESETDEFDYLAYAQDRALFFWADLLSMNLMREDELPAAMVEQVKTRIIEY